MGGRCCHGKERRRGEAVPWHGGGGGDCAVVRRRGGEAVQWYEGGGGRLCSGTDPGGGSFAAGAGIIHHLFPCFPKSKICCTRLPPLRLPLLLYRADYMYTVSPEGVVPAGGQAQAVNMGTGTARVPQQQHEGQDASTTLHAGAESEGVPAPPVPAPLFPDLLLQRCVQQQRQKEEVAALLRRGRRRAKQAASASASAASASSSASAASSSATAAAAAAASDTAVIGPGAAPSSLGNGSSSAGASGSSSSSSSSGGGGARAPGKDRSNSSREVEGEGGLLLQWTGEFCPPLWAKWSDYYKAHTRTPHIMQLAPWVAKRYQARLDALEKTNQGAGQVEAGGWAAGGGGG